MEGKMKHVFSVFLLMALCLVFGTVERGSAQSACTLRDRIDLAKAGYAKGEVESLCDPGSGAGVPSATMGILAGEGQSRWIQWCVTPQGRCPLNPQVVGYYPLGFPCNCYMPWGYYGGVAE